MKEFNKVLLFKYLDMFFLFKSLVDKLGNWEIFKRLKTYILNVNIPEKIKIKIKIKIIKIKIKTKIKIKIRNI